MLHRIYDEAGYADYVYGASLADGWMDSTFGQDSGWTFKEKSKSTNPDGSKLLDSETVLLSESREDRQTPQL